MGKAINKYKEFFVVLLFVGIALFVGVLFGVFVNLGLKDFNIFSIFGSDIDQNSFHMKSLINGTLLDNEDIINGTSKTYKTNEYMSPIYSDCDGKLIVSNMNDVLVYEINSKCDKASKVDNNTMLMVDGKKETVLYLENYTVMSIVKDERKENNKVIYRRLVYLVFDKKGDIVLNVSVDKEDSYITTLDTFDDGNNFYFVISALKDNEMSYYYLKYDKFGKLVKEVNIENKIKKQIVDLKYIAENRDTSYFSYSLKNDNREIEGYSTKEGVYLQNILKVSASDIEDISTIFYLVKDDVITWYDPYYFDGDYVYGISKTDSLNSSSDGEEKFYKANLDTHEVVISKSLPLGFNDCDECYVDFNLYGIYFDVELEEGYDIEKYSLDYEKDQLFNFYNYWDNKKYWEYFYVTDATKGKFKILLTSNESDDAYLVETDKYNKIIYEKELRMVPFNNGLSSRFILNNQDDWFIDDTVISMMELYDTENKISDKTLVIVYE